MSDGRQLKKVSQEGCLNLALTMFKLVKCGVLNKSWEECIGKELYNDDRPLEPNLNKTDEF